MSKNKLHHISDSHTSYGQRGRLFATPLYGAFISDRGIYRDISNDEPFWDIDFPEQNMFYDKNMLFWIKVTKNKFKKIR